MSFSPNPATLQVGAAIAWKNSDTVVHQIVQDSGGQASGGGYGGGGSGRSGFTTDQVTPGAMTSSITFTTAGVVNYHCAIHPTMRGSITATN
jgi:plastocyanin